MPVPWGSSGFTKVKDLIECAEQQGCEYRTLKAEIMTPWGARQVRYLFNPRDKSRVDISDLKEDEFVPQSAVWAVERRLGIDLSSRGKQNG